MNKQTWDLFGICFQNSCSNFSAFESSFSLSIITFCPSFLFPLLSQWERGGRINYIRDGDQLKCTWIPFPLRISAVLITMNYLDEYVAALVGFSLKSLRHKICKNFSLVAKHVSRVSIIVTTLLSIIPWGIPPLWASG